MGKWLFGSGEDAYIIAGVVISQIASVIAIGYLYAIVLREFGRRAAALTVVYLALFPMSFYLSAVYPEALFLAFAIAAIYYARRQSWLLASSAGGLAALSRAQGVLLIVPIGWEYLRVTTERYAPLPEQLPNNIKSSAKIHLYLACHTYARSESSRTFRPKLVHRLLFLLIPAGLLIFMIYAQIKTGDLLATFHTENWGWSRKFTFFGRLVIYSLRHPIINQPLNWNFWVLNIILAFLFLGVIRVGILSSPKHIHPLYPGHGLIATLKQHVKQF